MSRIFLVTLLDHIEQQGPRTEYKVHAPGLPVENPTSESDYTYVLNHDCRQHFRQGCEDLKLKSATAIAAPPLDDQLLRRLRVLSDHNVSNNRVFLGLGTTLDGITLACTSAILQRLLRRFRIFHVIAVEVRLTTCVPVDCVK